MEDLKKIQEFFSKPLEETTFKKGDKVSKKYASTDEDYTKEFEVISVENGRAKVKDLKTGKITGMALSDLTIEALKEGTFDQGEIAIYMGNDDSGTTHIFKRGKGYYGYNDEFDFEASSKEELQQMLDKWGYELLAGSLEESVNEMVKTTDFKHYQKLKARGQAVELVPKDEMKKKYDKDKSVNEAEFSPMGYARKVKSGKMSIEKAREESGIPYHELSDLVKKLDEAQFTDYSNNELAAYCKNNPTDKKAAKELHKRSQALKNLSRTDVNEAFGEDYYIRVRLKDAPEAMKAFDDFIGKNDFRINKGGDQFSTDDVKAGIKLYRHLTDRLVKVYDHNLPLEDKNLPVYEANKEDRIPGANHLVPSKSELDSWSTDKVYTYLGLLADKAYNAQTQNKEQTLDSLSQASKAISNYFNIEESINEGEDQIDTITMDVPLFIRALEYAREDAQADMDLHDFAEKAIAGTKEMGVLTMDNYDMLVGEKESVDEEVKGVPVEKTPATITRKEWNKLPKNAKAMLNGIAYVQQYDRVIGTYMAPTKIVDEMEEAEGYSKFLKDDPEHPGGKTKGLTPDVLNKILMKVVQDLDESRPGLWDNIRAKKERGEKPSHGNSKAHKDAVKAGKEINKAEK